MISWRGVGAMGLIFSRTGPSKNSYFTGIDEEDSDTLRG